MSEPTEAPVEVTPSETPPTAPVATMPPIAVSLSIKLIRVEVVATERSYGVRDLDADHVKELVASIGGSGLLQPIVVRKTGDGYELVAGAHRLAAMKELGIEQIEAVVLNEASDADAEAASLVENLKRLPMSDQAKSAALARLKELRDAGAGARRPGRPKKIGAPRTNFGPLHAAGASSHEVKRAALRERKMAPEVRAAWAAEKLTTGQVDELVKVSQEEQQALLPRVVGKGRDETRLLVKQIREPKEPEPGPATGAANEDQEVAVITPCLELTAKAQGLAELIDSMFAHGKTVRVDTAERQKLQVVLQQLHEAVGLALGKLQLVAFTAEPEKPVLQPQRRRRLQIVDVHPGETEAEAVHRASSEEA